MSPLSKLAYQNFKQADISISGSSIFKEAGEYFRKEAKKAKELK